MASPIHPAGASAPSGLLDRVRDWISDDPDPDTRAELTALLSRAEGGEEAAAADLADRFSAPLAFGTAGLRGALGGGPNRMNRVVVMRAAAGLAAYLADQGRVGTVVIGYDARHGSQTFAHDTADVLAGAGFAPRLLPRPMPTPVLAWAIRHLGAVAGVVVTASHNPPSDNGYKVYLGDGRQIVPPADVDIAAAIEAVGRVSDLPRGSAREVLGEDLLDSYLAAVVDLVGPGPRDLTVVHTPLHGVGGEPVRRALVDAGFPAPHVVPEQAEPDPDFPTVAFPNPEEPGAMDAALALAEQVGADLVLANDPDVDRCAVGVPTDGAGGGWRMLRGDEVGVLLADALLADGVSGVYATTIVSSSMLGRMARRAGQPYAETLTGFKWLGRVEGLVYGYEEALGYCVAPDLVRDKDGISAALRVAELAARLRAEGRSMLDRLDDLAQEHGLHATDQLSVRVDRLEEITEAMARLRTTPPTSLGGFAVEVAEDLREGGPDLPPTDGLRYTLAEGGRVVVRPSGTEPKLKCYLEVVVPVHPDDGVAAARIAAAGRLDAIRAELTVTAGLPTEGVGHPRP